MSAFGGKTDIAFPCAIRTCNRSLTKKRALSLQVRDPHDRDHFPVIIRLLFCVLVAGPGKVLLSRKGLSLLLDPKLPLGDMADLAFIIGGASVFDPGCIMTSRIETVLKPGMMDAVSPP